MFPFDDVIMYGHTVRRRVTDLASRSLRWTVGNFGYPFETHIELKFPEISFATNVIPNYQIVLKFCIEHHNTIAVLCIYSEQFDNPRNVDKFWLKCFQHIFPDS